MMMIMMMMCMLWPAKLRWVCQASQESLRAAGIVLDDRGGVQLEQVLSKGQELVKTEDRMDRLLNF